MFFFVDVPGAPQSQIYVGLEGPPRGSRDYEATLLMNEILGGGFGSRINMNLREKHGYAYGARSGFGYRRAFSTFAASSSVRTDATGPSLREISTELTNIRTGPPTDVELTRERTGAELQLPASFSTGSRILDTFSDLVFFGLPLDTYEGFRARLEAVDAAAIQRAASAHVRDKGVKVLVVGDGKVVRDDLEKIAREKLFGDEGFVELDADGKVIPAGKAAAAKAKGTVTGEPASQGSAKP